MIPNQWYANLESDEVKRGMPIGVTRMGEKLVFWRDEQGYESMGVQPRRRRQASAKRQPAS
ncbi:MAG: hypothetical protein MUO64_20615 [Anaerolineales bacterium]|nr:hypothetical protein [Anaerolineales bacterium]